MAERPDQTVPPLFSPGSPPKSPFSSRSARGSRESPATEMPLKVLRTCSVPRPDPGGVWVSLRPGDSLSALAVRHGVTPEQIKRLNQLFSSETLFLRNRILIPASDSNISCSNGSADSHNDVSSSAEDPGTRRQATENRSETNTETNTQLLDDLSGREFFRRIDLQVQHTRARIEGCTAKAGSWSEGVSCDCVGVSRQQHSSSPLSLQHVDISPTLDADDLIFRDDHFGCLNFELWRGKPSS
uniref:lysM and putative peptidoglycan-binding domain-containing protein 2-like n=1 Tax=Myxine glutinosa TaxID=7769 RepID=UPI00358DFCA1